VAGAVTFAQALASVDRESRNRLVEDMEDAIDGHSPAEVFLATAYFLAIAIEHLPCDREAIIDDMPDILRSVIRNETATVTLQ